MPLVEKGVAALLLILFLTEVNPRFCLLLTVCALCPRNLWYFPTFLPYGRILIRISDSKWCRSIQKLKLSELYTKKFLNLIFESFFYQSFSRYLFTNHSFFMVQWTEELHHLSTRDVSSLHVCTLNGVFFHYTCWPSFFVKFDRARSHIVPIAHHTLISLYHANQVNDTIFPACQLPIEFEKLFFFTRLRHT